jgi:hypothetical protein
METNNATKRNEVLSRMKVDDTLYIELQKKSDELQREIGKKNDEFHLLQLQYNNETSALGTQLYEIKQQRDEYLQKMLAPYDPSLFCDYSKKFINTLYYQTFNLEQRNFIIWYIKTYKLYLHKKYFGTFMETQYSNDVIPMFIQIERCQVTKRVNKTKQRTIKFDKNTYNITDSYSYKWSLKSLKVSLTAEEYNGILKKVKPLYEMAIGRSKKLTKLFGISNNEE